MPNKESEAALLVSDTFALGNSTLDANLEAWISEGREGQFALVYGACLLDFFLDASVARDRAEALSLPKGHYVIGKVVRVQWL